MFMAPILVLISILAVRGTMYNKRTGNKAGFVLGGGLTLGILLVTVLAVMELFGLI